MEGGTARGKGYTPKGGVFFRFTRQPVQRIVNFGRLEEEYPLAFRQCVKRIEPNLEDVGVLYFNELPKRKR